MEMESPYTSDKFRKESVPCIHEIDTKRKDVHSPYFFVHWCHSYIEDNGNHLRHDLSKMTKTHLH